MRPVAEKKGGWFIWGLDWRNKETRSEATFKFEFQTSRRVFACVPDRVEKATGSLEKLVSPATAAGADAASPSGALC